MKFQMTLLKGFEFEVLVSCWTFLGVIEEKNDLDLGDH